MNLVISMPSRVVIHRIGYRGDSSKPTSGLTSSSRTQSPSGTARVPRSDITDHNFWTGSTTLRFLLLRRAPSHPREPANANFASRALVRLLPRSEGRVRDGALGGGGDEGRVLRHHARRVRGDGLRPVGEAG